MRWLLWIVGAMIVVVLLVTVIGMLLPRDHVATRSARYNAPVDSIWSALVNVTDYPRWRSDVKTVEVLPPAAAKRSWRESSSQSSLTFVADEERAPLLLVTRIASTDVPFGGTWTYRVAQDGGGARVTITERGWVSNPIFRFVSRFIIGETATMDTYLRALGKRFGENVSPAAS